MQFKFKSALNAVFDWFANSPVRAAELNSPQLVDALGHELSESVKHLVKALWTRWLSSERSVNALKSSLTAVITVMQRNTKDAGTGVLKTLRTFKFVATLHLWAQVLPVFAKISRTFQGNSVSFDGVHDSIGNALESLDAFFELADKQKQAWSARAVEGKEQKGADVVGIDVRDHGVGAEARTSLSTGVKDPLLEEVDKHLLELKNAGVQITDGVKQRSEFASVRIRWVQNLRTRLKQRFPDVRLFQSLSTLLDPKRLPKTVKDAAMTNHGADALEHIIELFGCERPAPLGLEQTMATAKGAAELKKEAKRAAKAANERAQAASRLAPVPPAAPKSKGKGRKKKGDASAPVKPVEAAPAAAIPPAPIVMNEPIVIDGADAPAEKSSADRADGKNASVAEHSDAKSNDQQQQKPSEPVKPLIDAILIRAELPGFISSLIRLRERLIDIHPQKATPSMIDLLSAFLADGHAVEANEQCAIVVAAAVTTPLNTAQCERGFSAMNLLKNELRNRMSEKTLQQVMRVSLEAPPIATVSPEVWKNIFLKRWLAMRQRVIGSISYHLSTTAPTSSSSSSSSHSSSSMMDVSK